MKTNNPISLEGRTVLVTGASSGIGREVCVLSAQLGAKVILVGRNREQLQATADRLNGAPHHIEVFDCNQLDAIKDWLKQVSAEQGSLHGLVHCAGLQTLQPLRMMKRAKIDELLRINFLAAVELARAFRQRDVYQKPASLVFLSSVMGLVGMPALSIYCASKGALDSFCRALALEYADEAIRVNCVSSGLVRTEMLAKIEQQMTTEQFAAVEAAHPLGLGAPQDVANAVAFLLADTGRWITGTTLVVDGGYTAK